MNIQRFWNVAPVATINLVDMGILTSKFNKIITQIGVSAFDSYCNTSFPTPNQSRVKRNRKPTQRFTSAAFDMTPTPNDFFFEYQKINGFTRGLLHFKTSKEMKTLEEAIEKQIIDYFSFLDGKTSHVLNLFNNGILSLDIWAAVQRGEGAYHKNHVHEGVILSGVYYCSIPDDSAPLVMYKPENTECKNDEVDHQVILPVEGQMILFPPWLLHGVPRAIRTTNAPRVSFAFNLSGPIVLGDPWDLTR